MISSVEEIRRAKELLDEARQDDLDESGLPFDRAMPVGIMIEVPAAVYLAPRLIEEVDFFSIGTNDLIQYLLAVDRNNRRSRRSTSRSIRRCSARSPRSRRRRRTPARWSACAARWRPIRCATLLLLGLGLDDLSMGPFFIPVIKRLIRSVPFSLAEEVARDVRALSTAKEIKGYLFSRLKELGVIELMDIYH